MKSHQRVVREELSGKEEIPEGIILDIKQATIEEVDRETAKGIIEKYEWLGKMAAVNWFYYGIFFPDNKGGKHCAGVVCYGQEYIENLGIWDKYDYTGKIILLNRGACVHWAHPHSASKLIRNSMKLLPEKYKVITATVDDLAGEIGTIYQACGFHYIGSMRDNNPKVKSSKGDRSAWVIDNKIYTARNLRQKYGTTKLEVIKQFHPDVVKIKQNSKHRYFAFRGTKKEKKMLKANIAQYIKQYPKREDKDTVPLTLTDGYIR